MGETEDPDVASGLSICLSCVKNEHAKFKCASSLRPCVSSLSTVIKDYLKRIFKKKKKEGWFRGWLQSKICSLLQHKSILVDLVYVINQLTIQEQELLLFHGLQKNPLRYHDALLCNFHNTYMALWCKPEISSILKVQMCCTSTVCFASRCIEDVTAGGFYSCLN